MAKKSTILDPDDGLIVRKLGTMPESGPRSRPMLEEWVREIETACRKARTSFFFKQWGGVRKKSAGRHYRGRTFDEMPTARI